MTLTPARRVQAYFAVQFMSLGMINAYGGIWFASIGLTSFEIGLITAFPLVGMICVTVVAGRLADRASDWRQAIILGGLAAGLLPFGLYLADGFTAIAIVWTLLIVAQRVVVPVADAAAMRMSRREDMDFGRLRALTTSGYLLVIVTMGFVLGGAGVALFLPLFIGFGLLRTIAAFALPKMRAAVTTIPSQRRKFSAMMRPWFVLPLVGWAVIDTNHIVLNTFQALLWADQGIAVEVIGLLVALGAVAEAVMFYNFRHVAAKFSPLTLIAAAGGISVIRWLAMAQQPDVPVLVALQLLHALTYGMGFLACTNFIADNVPEDNAAEAQSFLVMIELALSAVALAGFGYIAGLWGSGAYYVAASVAGVGAGIVVVARRMRG